MAEQLNILVDVQTDEITELMRCARAEALAEAQSILKDAMLQAILAQVLEELESTAGKPPAKPEPAPAQGKAGIRQEIEAIRRQIAANNALLEQAPVANASAETAPASTANGRSDAAVDESVGEEGPSGEDEPESANDVAANECGYYVYGIIDQPADELPQQGVDPDYPVQTISYNGTWAVVSRVSLAEFNQETLEARVNDLDWLEDKVRQHQQVLEATMAVSSGEGCICVPMKFCTIYHTEARVREMLAEYYDDLVDALARLKGKQEWGVKLYYDDGVLAQRAGEVSERVQTLERRISEKSEGAAYFLKKQMEGTITDEVERISDEWAQRSYDCLVSHAVDAVINPLHGKEFTGQGETMVLNSAFLVSAEQLPAFQAELDRLRAECGELGFRYEYTGPWPAYNFVDIGAAGGMK